MTNLKDTLNNRVVTPSIESAFSTHSYGFVKEAYEGDNVCDITYIDSKGNQRNKERVEVDIKNNKDKWFPQKGDLVKVDVYEENVIIVGEVITDYSTQIKSQQYTENDIYADGDDSSVGCYIF